MKVDACKSMQRYAKNTGTLKGSAKVFKQKSGSLIGDRDHIKASGVTTKVTSLLLSASYDSVYTNLYFWVKVNRASGGGVR